VADLPIGEPVELVFDLHPTSNIFDEGHRIRITITFADRDNTLTPVLSPAPTVSVYRNADYASYIVLPVIPKRILIDNFNDGNDDGWFHIDEIADQPFGPAIFDASSGEYRLGSTGLITDPGELRTSDMASLWAPSSDPVYSNGFLRTRFRVTGNSTSTTFAMRASPDINGDWSWYAFGAVSSDRGFPLPRGANPGGVVFFEKIEPGGETYERRFYPPVDVPHLNEDRMLEAGVVGDRITMKWWRAGDPEPAEPQFQWTDPSPLPAGQFGVRIYISPRNVEAQGTTPPWRVGARIDDVYFTPSDVEDGPSPR
jgi:hypothetical protein